MSEIPMIATWCGQPVHELSRDELHAAFSQLIAENARLRDRAHDTSVAHIRDLAAMARGRK